jgi:signal peptidase I
MFPTISDSDKVVLYKTQDVERDDVIIFQRGDKILCKRVVGLGGDIVLTCKTGALIETAPNTFQSLNDNEYVLPWLANCGKPTIHKRVPQGHVFVLGDNRRFSGDSRHFGPVPIESVIGKVVWVLGREL